MHTAKDDNPTPAEALKTATRRVEAAIAKGEEELDLTDLAALRELPDAIRGATSLRELRLGGYAGHTQISDLSPLSVLIGLKRLWLTNMSIQDITVISGLTGLEGLDLNNTKLGDFSALSALTELKRLYLADAQISDITLLSGLRSLNELWLNNTPVSDLRPLLHCAKLAEEPFLGGLIYKNTSATQNDPVLAELAEIDDAKERGEKTFAHLRTLPPWPEALDNSVHIEEPKQNPIGYQAEVKSDDRIGFSPAPLGELSETAQDLYTDLLDDVHDLIDLCRKTGSNATLNLAGDLEAYQTALIGVDKVLETKPIYRTAQKMRRLDRIEQANAQDPNPNVERSYPNEVGETLKDLVDNHNAFAQVVPALAEKDRAGIDPAHQPQAGAKSAAHAVILEMKTASTGFDPEVGELEGELSGEEAENGPELRDQIVAEETTVNLLIAHVTRAWRETKRLLQTPEGKKLGWDAANVTATVAAVYALPLGAAGAVPIGSIFLVRNEKIILEFLDKHPFWGITAELVKKHNAMWRKANELGQVAMNKIVNKIKGEED